MKTTLCVGERYFQVGSDEKHILITYQDLGIQSEGGPLYINNNKKATIIGGDLQVKGKVSGPLTIGNSTNSSAISINTWTWGSTIDTQGAPLYINAHNADPGKNPRTVIGGGLQVKGKVSGPLTIGNSTNSSAISINAWAWGSTIDTQGVPLYINAHNADPGKNPRTVVGGNFHVRGVVSGALVIVNNRGAMRMCDGDVSIDTIGTPFYINHRFDAQGNRQRTSIGGDLSIGGNLGVNGRLTVNGGAVLLGHIEVRNTLTVRGNGAIDTNNLTVRNDLSVPRIRIGSWTIQVSSGSLEFRNGTSNIVFNTDGSINKTASK